MNVRFFVWLIERVGLLPVQAKGTTQGEALTNARLRNAAGTTEIEPRKEDGHGSAAATPSYVAITDSADAAEKFFINLSWRMNNKMPAPGYRLWMETGLTTFIYVAENVAAKVSTDVDFRGIRIPLDVAGNPSGKVEVNLAFRWSDKTLGSWT